MRESLFFNHILAFLVVMIISSCTPQGNQRQSEDTGSSNSVQVTNIAVVGPSLKINGSNLDEVESVSLTDDNGVKSEFQVESQSSNEIIADALGNTLLPLNQILSLTLETANGASTFEINVDLPDMGATNGQVLQYNSFTGRWGPANLTTSGVTQINGMSGAVSFSIDDLLGVDTSGAVAGSVLKYNGYQWSVGVDDGGVSSSGEANTILSTGGTSLYKQKVGSQLQLKGLLGSSDITISSNLNTVGIGVNTSNGANQLVRLDSSLRLPAVDGSQLTGIVASSANATQMQSRNISTAAPADGQALVWNGATSLWEPGTVAGGGGGGGAGEINTASSAGGVSLFQAKSGYDLVFKGLGNTSDITLTPGANSVEIGVTTSNNANQLLRLDSLGRLPAIDGSQLTGISAGGSSNATTLQSRSLSSAAPNDGEVLQWNGTTSTWEPTSLVTGGSSNAVTLQSFDVATTAPSDGQALLWNGTSSRWEPSTITSGGAGGETNTASSAGGVSLYQNKVGSNLVFKGLSNTSDIAITSNTNDVTIGVTTSNGAGELLRLDGLGRLPALDGSLLTGLSSGVDNTASSAGGTSIFKAKSGNDLVFKGLTNSSDIALTPNVNDIEISVSTSNGANQLLRLDSSGRLPAIDGSLLTGLSSGVDNTASSAGGLSIFKSKSGDDLVFKGLTSSSDITLTSNINDIGLSLSTANGANEILRLDSAGRIPALDGSLLTGISSDATTLQSRAVSSTAPTDGQALLWNATTSTWAPGTVTSGGASGETNTASSAGGTSLFQSKSGVDLIFKGLTSSSDITLTSNANDIGLSIATSNGANQLLRLDGSGKLPALDGSQLTGISGGSGDATTLQSRAVASTAPTDGQALLWNATTSTWAPGTVSSGGAGGETNTASSAGGTSLFQSKSGVDLIFKGLTSSSDITLTSNANDIGLSIATSNGANQLLRLDGSGKLPALDGSQLTGISGGSGDATTLQSRAVASTAPTDGQALLWNATTSTWAPGTVSSGGAGGETNTASSAGGTSLFQSKSGVDLVFKGLTSSSDVTLTSNTNDVQISIATSNGANQLLRLDSSGRLPALDGSLLTGISGGGGSGDATTLQSRAVATTAPSDGQVLSWNSTSSEWEPATVSGGGGGSADATTIQSRDVASTAPSDGQVLAWDSATSKWQPTSVSGAGGGSDATSIHGVAIADVTLDDGYIMVWDLDTNQWTPVSPTDIAGDIGDGMGDHIASTDIQLGLNSLNKTGNSNEGISFDDTGNMTLQANSPVFKIQDNVVGAESISTFKFSVDGGEAGVSALNSSFDYAGQGLDSSWANSIVFYSELNNGIRMQADAGDINFSAGEFATTILQVNATNENVGILTMTPSSFFALDVNGAVRGSGTFNTGSDRRFKKNIVNISNEVSILDQFKLLNGVYYDWRHEDFPNKSFKKGRDIGVIAQEVQKVFPEVVTEDDQGYLSVAYAKLVSPLIEAVKELIGITDNNSRDIASLEARTRKLEEENKMLKEALCEMNPKAKICLRK